MLSRTINVEWEFVSKGLSLSASQWYSAQHSFKRSICLLFPFEQLFWMRNNIQNTAADYIQMKSDLQCFAEHILYEYIAISKTPFLHICIIMYYIALMEHDEVKSKLITSWNLALNADKSVCCYFRESFALVSDGVQNDVLHVLLCVMNMNTDPLIQSYFLTLEISLIMFICKW